MTTSRREFIVRVAGLGAALSLPELLIADPYRPLAPVRRSAWPIRVRGRVIAGQRAVRGARVSDGRTVVRVDDAGRFDFVSTDTQRYVSVSPPAGYTLPTNPTGTLRLHAPLAPSLGDELTHQFDLVARPTSDDRHAILVLADPQTEDAFEMKRFHDETVPDVVKTRQALGDQTPLALAAAISCSITWRCIPSTSGRCRAWASRSRRSSAIMTSTSTRARPKGRRKRSSGTSDRAAPRTKVTNC